MIKKKPESIIKILNNKNFIFNINKIIIKYNKIKQLNKLIKKNIPKYLKKKINILNITNNSILIETCNINNKIYLKQNKNKIISILNINNIKYFFIIINPNLNIKI